MKKLILAGVLSIPLPCCNSFGADLEDLKSAGKEAIESSKSKANKIFEGGKNATKEIYSRAKTSLKGERTSRDNRGESILTINWSPFVLASFPLPKSGYQAGWIVNEAITLDPEFLSGGIGFSISKLDIGKISDSLIIIPIRYFPGNSFNYKVGGTYRKLAVVLGDSILSKIINRPAHLDLLEYKSYSLNLAFGNRWQLNNGITLGADWVDVNIPLSVQKNETITTYITDESDKKNVKNGIEILTAVQFTSLKFQIGYTF